LVAQLAEPLLVGRLRRPIEHRQAVAGVQALVSDFWSPAVLPRPPTSRLQPLSDEIQHMELASRVAQEVGDVAQALRVLHAAHGALIGEGPEVALVTEECGSRRSGIGGRVSCLGGLRNCLDTIRAGLLALRPQRLGALDPARHADGLELLTRDIEERSRPLAIPVRLAPDLHPGLVEVDERTQRACALLVEDGAGALEPLVGFTGASRKRAELRHPQARVDAGLAEVAGERLGEQIALQNVGEVSAAETPERLAAAAD